MNAGKVQSHLWNRLSLGSYATALLMGLYGRHRSDFSSDFTFNVPFTQSNFPQKYHFGVLINLGAGAGLYMSAKVPLPW